MPTIPTNGFNTYYEIEGQGHPLVLIHGHTFNLRMWDGQVPIFATKYKVIRYDVRGHGKSEAPETGYTLPDYAQDLYELLAALGIEKTHVLGLSMGGGIALEFTLTHPEMVTGLVLADTTLEGFAPSPDFVDFHREFTDCIRKKDVATALEECWFPRPIFDGVRNKPETFDRLKTMAGSFSGAPYLDPTERPERELCQLARLDEIKVRTQIIIGANDTQSFRDIAQILRNNLSHYEKVKIPNSGHMVNMEQPRLFNWAVMDFLSRLEESK